MPLRSYCAVITLPWRDQVIKIAAADVTTHEQRVTILLSLLAKEYLISRFYSKFRALITFFMFQVATGQIGSPLDKLLDFLERGYCSQVSMLLVINFKALVTFFMFQVAAEQIG